MNESSVSVFKFLRWRSLVVLGGIALIVGIGGVTLPFWPEYHLWRGRQLLWSRQVDAALQEFQRAREIDPGRAETHFWLARTYRRLGQFQQVRKYLKQAQQFGYSVQALQREQWLTLAQAGQLVEAEPHLAGLLTNPGDDGREICEAFVNGYCINLRFDAALRLLDAWQADYPQDPEPHFRRGFIRQAVLDPAGAVRHYREGLRWNPERTDGRLRLAQCLLDMNQLDAAEREFRQCLEQQPENLDALVGLANCLAGRKQMEEARNLYRQVIEQDANHFEARHGMGQLAFADEQPHKALQWLQPLIEQRPNDTALNYLLAQVYRALGRRDAAETLLTKVQRSEEPLRRLDQLLEDVLQHPHKVELRYEIGQILMRYGSADDGARWLRTVLQIDPQHRQAHLALADYYAQRGQEDRARDHRQQAEDISKNQNE